METMHPDDVGPVAIQEAIDSGDIEALRQAVLTHGTGVDRLSSHVRHAAIFDRPDMIAVLCTDRGSLSKYTTDILSYCVVSRACKSVDFLLECGVDFKSSSVERALRHALEPAAFANAMIVQSFMRAYKALPSPPVRDSNLFVMRQLEAGVETGKVEIVEAMLAARHPVDPNALETYGCNDQTFLDKAFIKAVMTGHFKIMDILKNAGADLHGKGRKPSLEWGVISGKIEIVQYLLDMKAKPEPYMIEIAESCGLDDIVDLLKHAIPSKPIKRQRKRC